MKRNQGYVGKKVTVTVTERKRNEKERKGKRRKIVLRKLERKKERIGNGRVGQERSDILLLSD